MAVTPSEGTEAVAVLSFSSPHALDFSLPLVDVEWQRPSRRAENNNA